MDTRQLRAFLTVYECGNITAAAQRLFVTQPSLSATLQQLEDSLGAALFERLPRGVRPTDAGARLYPQARRLLAELAALRRQFGEGGACTALEVGIEEDLGPVMTSRFCALLGKLDPAPLLTLRQGCEGELRLGLPHRRCAEEQFLPLWRDDMLVAVPAGHRLADVALLSPADVAGEEWAVCTGDPSHLALTQALEAWQPAFPAKVDSLTLAAAMVAAGQALACLPRSMLPAGAVGVPLEGLHHVREVGLSYHPAALQQAGPAALLLACQQGAAYGLD
ncbi:LysR family transcriptional regulator [Chitinimonas sp.]|uniref:LysR family transcriptional regulator n=1 Tax=Chitinimonas sp. TaxID=1934313 RepID=UPI0035B13D44